MAWTMTERRPEVASSLINLHFVSLVSVQAAVISIKPPTTVWTQPAWNSTRSQSGRGRRWRLMTKWERFLSSVQPSPLKSIPKADGHDLNMLGGSQASLTRSSPEGWSFPPTWNNHETSADLKTNHQFQSFHHCQSVLIAAQTSDGVCLSSGFIRIYYAPSTSYPESHRLIIISAEQQCSTKHLHNNDKLPSVACLECVSVRGTDIISADRLRLSLDWSDSNPE